MPYNPGSAYPRKTVYVPPTYGDTSFQRAINAPDVSSQAGFGSFYGAAKGREAYAGTTAAANQAAMHPGASAGFEGMSRTGGIGDQLANRYKEQQGLRREAAASAAAKPQEMMTPAELADANMPKGTYNPEGNPARMEKAGAARSYAGALADRVLDKAVGMYVKRKGLADTTGLEGLPNKPELPF